MGKAKPTSAGLRAAREVLDKTPGLMNSDESLLALALYCNKLGEDRFRLLFGLRPPSNPIEAASVDHHCGRITMEQFGKLLEAEAMRPLDGRMLECFFTALDERVVAYGNTLAEVFRQGHAVETGVLIPWDPDAFDEHPWKEPLPLTSNEVQTVAAFLGEVRIEKNLGLVEMAGYSEESAASLAFRVFDTLRRLLRFVTENTINYGSLPEVYRELRAGRLPFGIDLQTAVSRERSAAFVVLRDRAKPAPTFPENITVGALTVQSKHCDVIAESATVSAESVTADSVSERNVLRREGDLWIATYATRTTHVKHSVGLGHIARLVAKKGKPIDALAIVAAASGRPQPPSDAGIDLTDDQALAQAQSEYEDLEEQLEEAREFNDPGRQEEIARQKAQLAAYILSPRGLGDRLRKFRGDAERARSSISQAIARAIKKLADQHPELATHFERSIRTGASLCYAPSPDESWEL